MDWSVWGVWIFVDVWDRCWFAYQVNALPWLGLDLVCWMKEEVREIKFDQASTEHAILVLWWQRFGAEYWILNTVGWKQLDGNSKTNNNMLLLLLVRRRWSYPLSLCLSAHAPLCVLYLWEKERNIMVPEKQTHCSCRHVVFAEIHGGRLRINNNISRRCWFSSSCWGYPQFLPPNDRTGSIISLTTKKS